MLPRFLALPAVCLTVGAGLISCNWMPQPAPPSESVRPSPQTDTQTILRDSWSAYRQRFVQADGRVIDWEANQRTTSEGQAYALLRAAIANDPTTFARVLDWAENNLRRKEKNGASTDSLWAWQWGRDSGGKWGILDGNFASDADIDTIHALLLADRRWQRPEYRKLAQTKLQDLWKLSTITDDQQRRHLLPGPLTAFRQDDRVTLNPSYFAPYAYRLFAQVDPTRNWLSLVDSSYQVLEASSDLSSVGLPSDWIGLNLKTGKISALTTAKPGPSQYGFDATRTWWRTAIDAAAFKEPRALQYLQRHLGHVKTLWRSNQKIPAQIDLSGRPLVNYEATSQYGMLYAAFQLVDPTIAQEIYQQKLLPQYRQGFWDNNSAYYTQNLVWFGLLPPTVIISDLLPPSQAAQDQDTPKP
jgi:endoglucanase